MFIEGDKVNPRAPEERNVYNIKERNNLPEAAKIKICTFNSDDDP